MKRRGSRLEVKLRSEAAHTFQRSNHHHAPLGIYYRLRHS